jgi:hypothetical protein
MARHGRWHGIVIHAIADRDPVGACVRQRHCLTGRFAIAVDIDIRIEFFKIADEGRQLPCPA